MTGLPARPRDTRIPGLIGGLAAGLALVAFVLSRISFLSTMPRPLADLYLQVRGAALALAPDGNTLAYVADHGDDSWVELRRVDGGSIRRIAGTRGAKTPRFSADGRYLAFIASGKWRRVSIDSAEMEMEPIEAPIDIEDACFRGDGSVLTSSTAGLFLTSPAGQTTELVRARVHSLATIGGSDFIALEVRDEDGARLEALSLASGARQKLVARASMPGFHPPDHLLYLKDSAIWRSRFDAASGELAFGPAVLVPDVDWFDVSANGTLAFRSIGGPRPAVRIVLHWDEELNRLGARSQRIRGGGAGAIPR
jgi:WD40-like Beta Propeller Repeat